PGLQAHAAILDLWIRLFTQPEGWADEAHREATRAISTFDAQGNERGLAKGWSLLGLFHMMKGRFATAGEAWGNAAAHAAAAGDPGAAERDLRWGVDTLRGIGELSWMSSAAAILAEALYEQGRLEDGEEFVRVSEESAGSEDTYSQSLLRSVRAKTLARQGRASEAEALARQAVTIAEPTDFLFLQAWALIGLGEVLERAGKHDEAEAVLADAVQICERKGFVVGARRARAAREGTPHGPA